MKTLKTKTLLVLFAMLLIITVKAQNTAISKTVNTVISNYLALKDALKTANGDDAKSAAKTLLTSIKEVPKANFNKSQLSIWTSYEAKLQFDSRHISEVDHLAHQREHFASLSKNLYTILKGLKLNRQTLYWQYCTMRSTYYISESANGKDPYMGMENCSKVKDTLQMVK